MSVDEAAGAPSGAPLAAAPDPAPTPAAEAGKRTRAPVYDVFELRTLHVVDHGVEEGSGREVQSVREAVEAWVQIGKDVRADSQQAAIREAVADRPQDEQYGTFAAPLAGALKPRTRRQQVITDDVWE